MIFDTDVFIWAQRGNKKAAQVINHSKERYLSVQTYIELLQHANTKKQHTYIKEFLSDYNFEILPLTENIGHRASIYIEEYFLSCNLSGADAIIAATANENNMTLVSSNARHFKVIKDLKLKVFQP